MLCRIGGLPNDSGASWAAWKLAQTGVCAALQSRAADGDFLPAAGAFMYWHPRSFELPFRSDSIPSAPTSQVVRQSLVPAARTASVRFCNRGGHVQRDDRFCVSFPSPHPYYPAVAFPYRREAGLLPHSVSRSCSPPPYRFRMATDAPESGFLPAPAGARGLLNLCRPKIVPELFAMQLPLTSPLGSASSFACGRRLSCLPHC